MVSNFLHVIINHFLHLKVNIVTVKTINYPLRILLITIYFQLNFTLTIPEV